MQDDLLMDKSKTQPQEQQQQRQQQQQQQQPEPSAAEVPSTSLSAETPKPEDSSAVPALSPAVAAPSPSSSSSASSGPDKMQIESPLLPGLSFQQPPPPPPPPPQEPTAPGASLSPSFGSTWSTGTTNAVEDSFFQGITPVNGTMLFQNFPHHVNPVFGGTFSPQIGLAQTQHPQQQPPPPAQPPQQPQQQQQQQRRSPASPSQAPYVQRSAAAAAAYGHQPIMTSKPSSSSAVAVAAAAAAAASSASSSWNTHQSVNVNAAAWSAPSNPWGGLQAGRDPRRAVGVGVGVGVGVPSPLNPISPLKKPFSSNVIAPPKFPRAAPLASKSWMEDNAFRTDNGNSLLPFQDRSRP